jgi:hypothetical protein
MMASSNESRRDDQPVPHQLAENLTRLADVASRGRPPLVSALPQLADHARHVGVARRRDRAQLVALIPDGEPFVVARLQFPDERLKRTARGDRDGQSGNGRLQIARPFVEFLRADRHVAGRPRRERRAALATGEPPIISPRTTNSVTTPSSARTVATLPHHAPSCALASQPLDERGSRHLIQSRTDAL